MALAVETPARQDLSLRDNDDKLVGAKWMKSDGTTPVTIASATLTFQSNLPPAEFDPDTGEPIPPPLPETVVITSTTPNDPAGWFDATGFTQGIALATVPHALWDDIVIRTGIWDLVAFGGGLHRCLVRGQFVVEDGVSDG